MPPERAASIVSLSCSLKRTSQGAPHIQTQAFVECCDSILPFFDHLGPLFHVARAEMQQKLEVLKLLMDSKPTLVDIVQADRDAKQATVKNSPTRNLHRLTAAILFVKLLFEKLLASTTAAAAAAAAAAANPRAGCDHSSSGSSSTVTLREAASFAYEASLAPFHSTMVKGVVRAGMLTLPSRESFIASLGETEESAAAAAHEVVVACQALHSSVTSLFDGIDMPASSVWLWPSSS